MTTIKTAEQRKEAYLQEAEKMFMNMESWYDDHPSASLEEIEAELRRHRRELMGKSLELIVNGRDEGKTNELTCPSCQRKMKYKGMREKSIYGIEGDTKLKRAYYTCPTGCPQKGVFPPR